MVFKQLEACDYGKCNIPFCNVSFQKITDLFYCYYGESHFRASILSLRLTYNRRLKFTDVQTVRECLDSFLEVFLVFVTPDSFEPAV